MSDQNLFKILIDHEKRIAELEKQLGIKKDPALQKVVDNLIKGVEEQNARTGN